MLKIAVHSLIGIALLGSVAAIRFPHHARAIWHSAGHAVHAWFGPGFDIQVARERLDHAENKVAAAMATVRKQESAESQAQQELGMVEQHRVALTQRIDRCRDVVERRRNELSPDQLVLLNDEVSRLKAAYDRASAREKAIRDQIHASQNRRHRIEENCRNLLAKIDLALVNLANEESRVAVHEAGQVLAGVEQSIAELARIDELDPAQILADLRREPVDELLVRPSSDTAELLAEFDRIVK